MLELLGTPLSIRTDATGSAYLVDTIKQRIFYVGETPDQLIFDSDLHDWLEGLLPRMSDAIPHSLYCEYEEWLGGPRDMSLGV